MTLSAQWSPSSPRLRIFARAQICSVRRSFRRILVRGSHGELAQGAQDHLIALAIEEAAATDRTVTTTAEPWTS